MSRYYLINLAGGTLEEEKMADIPHPYLELGLHITLKTAQAFALLGLGAVGPVLGLAQGKDKKETAMRCCQVGAVSGTLFGPVLSLMVNIKQLRIKFQICVISLGDVEHARGWSL